MTVNRQIVLARYPDGVPSPGDFAEVAAPLPEPGPGQLLVRVDFLGLDPFPRLRMRADSPVGPPLPLGQVVEGRGVGTVLRSTHPGFAPGDPVACDTGWQAFACVDGARAEPLDLACGPRERHLSTLGPSGLTGWFALAAIEPRAGAALVLAPAAGSVGVIAGQLAKAAGCRVVGIVASAAQGEFLTATLGFDAAVAADDLAAATPDGIDGFIDGVGGALHDAVAARLNLHARVLLLGFIAAYNDAAPPRYGNMLPILFKRARVAGFLLADHAAGFAEARAGLAARLDDGRLRAVETVHHGLGATPAAFAGLFAEPPPGKQIVRIDHPAEGKS